MTALKGWIWRRHCNLQCLLKCPWAQSWPYVGAVESLICPCDAWMEGRAGRCPGRYDLPCPLSLWEFTSSITWLTVVANAAPSCPSWHALFMSCRLSYVPCFRIPSPSGGGICSCKVMFHFRDLPNSLSPNPHEQKSDIVHFNHEATVGRKGERQGLV